jgi:type IV pilus assembly protein PilQ
MANVPRGLKTWLMLMLAAGFTACQHSEQSRSGSQEKPRTKTEARPAAPTAKTAASAKGAQQLTDSASASDRQAPAPAKAADKPAPAPVIKGSPPPGAVKESAAKKQAKTDKKVSVSSAHDEEIKKIIELTKSNKWEEAESRASALYAMDPKDAGVQRVYKWVQTEGPKRREKALENEIRDISSRDSRFSPTVKSIFTDKKSQGLPPRSDLRDTIEQIKAAPYIPDTFGKTIQAKGNMEDFQNAKGPMADILEKNIEVHLDNVPLETILFNIGQSEGINFIADKGIPAFQQKLSVNMKSVKLSEFLSFVARNMGVQFQMGGDLIWITDAKDATKIREQTRFYRLRKGFVLPAQFGMADPTRTSAVTGPNVTTVTEMQKVENFVRDGAPKEPSIEAVIKKFFEGSKYQIDYERNMIMARGTDDQLKVIEKIIDQFDKPIQQVLIEARFITVTEATFLQLGVSWETGRNPLTAGQTATDYTGLGQNVGLGLQESWMGVLGRKSLSATLTALDQSGESETLSAPRVAVINNLPATIRDGKVQYYYEEYTVSKTMTERTASSSLVPSGKPTSVNSGVSLNVLASIGGDGKSILLAVNPEVSADVKFVTFATVSDRNDQGQISSSFDIKLPEVLKQSLSTRVVVKSGQTVALGGVMQREQKTFVEAVPVLGRLPLIGALFRKRTEVDKPRYLLVFVTATLLSENGEFIISTDAE